ncbi:unnamed protein product [Brassica oleracea]
MFTAVTYLSAGIDLVFSCVNITSISYKVIIVSLSFSMSIESYMFDSVFVSVSVGMGLLAGSTVTLLSIIWRTCTVVGKCNIRDTIAVNNQDTRSFHLKVVEFVWVVSAKEKFVAETLKHLTMEITGARRKKLYEATVWVKPRMNFKELCR